MNSPKFFLFIFVFLFFLTILPSKNTVWGQPVSFNTTISASMNASNTISFTAVFAPQAGTAKTILIGRCLAANCATTQNMPTCPNSWNKNTGSTTDPWCRFSVTPASISYSSSVSMSGMPAGKYVILVSQNFNSTQKCSGNPNCTFNGGQVNCSGFSSCHPSADFVTFDVAAPTRIPTPPTAAPTVFITPTLNAAIILNSNVNNVIEYSATFSPLDYGRTGVYSNKEVIIGRCNNNDCSIVADSLICPSGFTKAAGNEKWCRRTATTDSLGNETPNPKVKVDMNGLSGGKYVILVSQSYRSQNNLFPEIKCSGNPTCTFNGGQVNCSGFSSCHPSADFVTFDVAAPTPTATPVPLGAIINQANSNTFNAVWNDNRGSKYIVLTKCTGTTCNNNNSFTRLANCPSPTQIGLTASDSEVSDSTSKWCKYRIASDVVFSGTTRIKSFTFNRSSILGPGKFIFALNQEVEDSLKCSGNPACQENQGTSGMCGWPSCHITDDAVTFDVAAPTPTATPVPLGAIINQANSNTFNAVWNDNRGSKYIVLTKCTGTTCNNNNSFTRLANCPSPTQIGLTASDSEVSDSTSKWCKYRIASDVVFSGTTRIKSFTFNRSSILGPGKFIFALNQEVEDSLKCSGNPACQENQGTSGMCGWPSCHITDDAVTFDVAAPTSTATPIPPTAIPTPTATATVVPPTAIPTPIATNIPTATNTLAPTNTVSPTATVAPITPTLTTDTCPNFAKGDATCDPGGIIDDNDYNCWKTNFLTARSGVTPTLPSGCLRVADFNSDANVNLFDFAIWRIGYKSSISPAPTTNP